MEQLARAARLAIAPVLLLAGCQQVRAPHATPAVPPAAVAGTLLFSDDFESGGLSAWTGGTGLAVTAGAGSASSWGAVATLAGSGAYAYTDLDSSQADLTVELWLRPNDLSGASAVNFLKVREATGRALAEVFLTSSGVLGVRDDVAGTSYHSGTRLALGSAHLVGLHVVVDGGASRLRVSLDGTVVPGLDRTVDYSGSPGMARVQVGENVPGRTAELALDDVNVWGPDTAPPPPPPPPPPTDGTSLFADDFETGDLAAWTGGSGLQVVAGQGLNSSWGAWGAMDGAGAWAYATLPYAVDELTASLSVRPVDLAGSSAVNFLKLRTSSGSALAEVFVTSTGVLGVRDDVGRVSYHSAARLAVGSWAQVALDATVSGPTSHLTVRLDGVAVDGLDLAVDLGASGVGRVQVGENVLGRVAQLAYDDVSVTVPAPPSGGDPVLMAAGDIACDPLSPGFNGGYGTSSACRQRAVSDLVLADPAVSAVAALGDVQYFCGGAAAFAAAYDPSWGRFLARTHPAIGNHEYLTGSTTDPNTDCDPTGRAAGYFGYFGAAAGDPTKGYYSYDLGAWHVVVLNSNCADAGGCGPGTPQETWLRQDLAAHPTACTLAYWHIPIWSSGGRAARNATDLAWTLYDAGADVVLTGHDHIYERFAPQAPDGTPDPTRGLRAFVVGTGGANHTTIDAVAPNSELRNTDTFGVLRLVLHPAGYDWSFVPEPGGTFHDSGSASCH